ncbi:Mov34/MPN/PAD-1 family protein [Paenibacillus curdlanolyticus YK9]|uniref:Mov34/MPN/PAD-1 family protein n=1 Tax=Paenibacillus curdlanolyticus YK9 TaxID=717606 RepID=E0I305_9BACL|nr:M67 family metallopeptidase [Paenibacillus curdlanolyticus]EFM12669.1 Mov34/MPN/PAD-1 family protein [Paenibacillus curdlanolyticus YK9]
MRNSSPDVLMLTREAYSSLLDHGQTCLPNEACGLLVYSQQPRLDSSPDSTATHALIVDTIVPIPNAHPHPLHAFAFEPQAWTAALYRLMQTKQTLVGYYHSHPTTTAIPSAADASGLPIGSDPVMLIVSFAAATAELNAYRHISFSHTWESLALALVPPSLQPK